MNRRSAVLTGSAGLVFAFALTACGNSTPNPTSGPSDTRVYFGGSVSQALIAPGSGTQDADGSPAIEAVCTDLTIRTSKGAGLYNCNITYADGITVPHQRVNVDDNGKLSAG